MTMFLIRNPMDTMYPIHSFPVDEMTARRCYPYHHCNPYPRHQHYMSRTPVRRPAFSYPWEEDRISVSYPQQINIMNRLLNERRLYEKRLEEERRIRYEKARAIQDLLAYERKLQQEKLLIEHQRLHRQRNEQKEKNKESDESSGYLLNFIAPADDKFYELRMSVPPHASVSNVSMELLPSSTAALRLLQVSIDLELRRSLAQYGQAWQMVSVAQQSVTRTLSLPNDAQLAGISVTLESKKEESDGDEVDHELVIRIPRVGSEEKNNEMKDVQPATPSESNHAAVPSKEPSVVDVNNHNLQSGSKSSNTSTSEQDSVSDVTVEDVESDDDGEDFEVVH